MKKTALLLVCTAMMVACNNRQTTEATVETKTLRDGDMLILCVAQDYSIYADSVAVDSIMKPLRHNAGVGCDSLWQGLPERMHNSLATAMANEDEMIAIHVAIVDHEADSDYIIDATVRRGVSRYPLADFLQDFTLPDGGLPVIYIVRPSDSTMAHTAVAKALQYSGKAYDVDFNESDSTMYCSELVLKSYLNADGTPHYSAKNLNLGNKEGVLPPYWQELFALIGKEVPCNRQGLLPIDIYRQQFNK